ncbi:MAG: T9SS type A sorting domain-containing protein [Bacteroidota bacterium]|jgi:hypothetical protein
MKSLVVLCLLLVEISYAQNAVFPLQVGDRWKYKVYVFSPSDSVGSYEIKVVGDTTLANGKKYAIRNWIRPGGLGQEYLRADSQKVFAYSPHDSSECILYQFDLQVGDTICYSEYNGEQLRTIFGKQLRVYSFSDFIPGFGTDIADSLGVIFYYGDLGLTEELTGAVINGVTYGTIVDVSNNHGVQPNNCHLSQNYPNPFNPSTSISFSIEHAGWVNLSIFDVLGRRVAVLVNEIKHPGNHIISWNPESIPSGVYFYQLRSSLYTYTKQMIYVK